MSGQEEKSDSQLFLLIQQNDRKALKIIFQKYYPYLCKAAYRVVSDEHKAKDLAQDVFFELWKKKENITIKTSLKAYLGRAVVNKSLNYIKSRKIKFEEPENFAEDISESARAQSSLELEDIKVAINEAVESLPERCKIVFSLSRYEQLSHKEIAEKLGITVKTVESQITKALRVIRQNIQKHGLNTFVLLFADIFL